MIDIKDIRTRYSEIEKNIETRYMNVDLAKIAACHGAEHIGAGVGRCAGDSVDLCIGIRRADPAPFRYCYKYRTIRHRGAALDDFANACGACRALFDAEGNVGAHAGRDGAHILDGHGGTIEPVKRDDSSSRIGGTAAKSCF